MKLQLSYMDFSRYLSGFFVFNLYLELLNAADPNYFTFSFNNFVKDSNFDSRIALFGNAKVDNFSTSVQITAGSRFFSEGRVVCKKPVNFTDGKSNQMVSFSSYFVFSMSSENGDGLAFVLLSADFPLNAFDGGSLAISKKRKIKFLGVEFDTSMDNKFGDMNSNHVGLDVASLVSVKASNVSSINLVLNSGEKVQAWIDYEAISTRFEVRMSKLGQYKPIDPLLSYNINLSEMWQGENVTVGFCSSSGNSSQKVNLYSWSFNSRAATPKWMHSQPLDPADFPGANEVAGQGQWEKGEEVKVTKRSDCHLRILAALVFGTGCGTFVVLCALFVWNLLVGRRPKAPEGSAVQCKEIDEYKKFNVSAK